MRQWAHAELGQVIIFPRYNWINMDVPIASADPTAGTITLVEEWESQVELDRRLRSEEYRAVLATIELAQEQPVIHFDTVTRRAGLEIVASARG